MGYSYCARTGRLACDSCGAAEGKTRKRTCPHKVDYPEGGSLPYCSPAALCPECHEKHRDTLHADCKAGAARSTARYRAEHDRVLAGDPMVKAAFGSWHKAVPEGKTGVLFVDRDRRDVYRLVPADDYKGGGFLSDYPNAEPWRGPDAAPDAPLPTLEPVREEERPTPQLADAPSFALTAECADTNEYQADLFNGPPIDFHE